MSANLHETTIVNYVATIWDKTLAYIHVKFVVPETLDFSEILDRRKLKTVHQEWTKL